MTSSVRPEQQPPGVHHRMVGDIVVTALSDGTIEGAFEWLTGVEPAEAERMYRVGFRTTPPRLSVNAFLLHLPNDRVVLVDAGCGAVMGPTVGRLAANLRVIGIEPGDVDVILATHLHPDHVGGLVDANGKAMFANAELVVHAAEPRFWADDATLAHAATEQDRQFIGLARATLGAYGGRTRQVTEGEVLSGVTAVPEPGHTPGHTGWRIGSGADALLIWGDIVHMPGVQFVRPDAGMGFDVDGAQAIATRQRILDMAATDRLCVAGMHLDFPAFGHVVRAGEGYAFVPEVWRPTLV